MSQPLNVYSACLLLHLEEKQGTLVGAKCRRWDFMHLMMMQFQNLKPHHEKHQSYMTPIQQPSLTFLRVQAIGKKGPLFLIFTSCALTPPNQKKEWSRCKWILPDETGTWMSGWRMRALGFAEVVGRCSLAKNMTTPQQQAEFSKRTWVKPGSCGGVSSNKYGPSWHGGWQGVGVLSSDLHDIDPAHYISKNSITQGAQDEAHRGHQIPEQGIKSLLPPSLSVSSFGTSCGNCHSHGPLGLRHHLSIKLILKHYIPATPLPGMK